MTPSEWTMFYSFSCFLFIVAITLNIVTGLCVLKNILIININDNVQDNTAFTVNTVQRHYMRLIVIQHL